VQLLNQNASTCIAATLAAPPATKVSCRTQIVAARRPCQSPSLIAMPKRQRQKAAAVDADDDGDALDEQPDVQGAADVDSDTQSDSAVTDGSEEADSADDDDGSSMDDEASSRHATGAVTRKQELMALHRCRFTATLLVERAVYVQIG
jgi:hypothetical protein